MQQKITVFIALSVLVGLNITFGASAADGKLIDVLQQQLSSLQGYRARNIAKIHELESKERSPDEQARLERRLKYAESLLKEMREIEGNIRIQEIRLDIASGGVRAFQPSKRRAERDSPASDGSSAPPRALASFVSAGAGAEAEEPPAVTPAAGLVRPARLGAVGRPLFIRCPIAYDDDE